MPKCFSVYGYIVFFWSNENDSLEPVHVHIGNSINKGSRYQNGYEVGKYISLEKKIEDTKDRYYNALQEADLGWDTEENDPTPFIRYMLQTILACYIDFEDRVGLLTNIGTKSNSYDVVLAYAQKKIGKFTSSDVVVNCPSVSRSSALAALKKMVEKGIVERLGQGKATYYLYRGNKGILNQ